MRQPRCRSSPERDRSSSHRPAHLLLDDSVDCACRARLATRSGAEKNAGFAENDAAGKQISIFRAGREGVQDLLMPAVASGCWRGHFKNDAATFGLGGALLIALRTTDRRGSINVPSRVENHVGLGIGAVGPTREAIQNGFGPSPARHGGWRQLENGTESLRSTGVGCAVEQTLTVERQCSERAEAVGYSFEGIQYPERPRGEPRRWRRQPVNQSIPSLTAALRRTVNVAFRVEHHSASRTDALCASEKVEDVLRPRCTFADRRGQLKYNAATDPAQALIDRTTLKSHAVEVPGLIESHSRQRIPTVGGSAFEAVENGFRPVGYAGCRRTQLEHRSVTGSSARIRCAVKISRRVKDEAAVWS